MFRPGGTKSKPTVCTLDCRPGCSGLWDLRISRTDSLYQWRGLNQPKMAAAGPYAAGKSKFSVWFAHTVRQTKICFFRPHKAPPPPRLVWLRPRHWYKLSVRIILKSHSLEHQGRQFTVQTVGLDLVPPGLNTSQGSFISAHELQELD